MIDYRENSLLHNMTRLGHGSVILSSLLYSIPSGVLTVVLIYYAELHKDGKVSTSLGIGLLSASQVYAMLTTVVSLMVGFRMNQSLGRFWEGTTLLHRMRGEWFDSVSCLVAFSRKAKKSHLQQVNEFRHTLVRLMSLMHACAMMEISDGPDVQKVLDLSGLDDKTLELILQMKTEHQFDMVEILQHLIKVLITHNLDIGVLTVPPPILSRVYQTLSRGFVDLLNAKKIRDTHFPFPYVQLMYWMLSVQALATPFVVASLLAEPFWGFVVTCGPIFFTTGINTISAALEMPFGSDANDLPLKHFQKELNKSLLLLMHESADHLAGSIPHAAKFDGVKARFMRNTYKEEAEIPHDERMELKAKLLEAATVSAHLGDTDSSDSEVAPTWRNCWSGKRSKGKLRTTVTGAGPRSSLMKHPVYASGVDEEAIPTSSGGISKTGSHVKPLHLGQTSQTPTAPMPEKIPNGKELDLMSDTAVDSEREGTGELAEFSVANETHLARSTHYNVDEQLVRGVVEPNDGARRVKKKVVRKRHKEGDPAPSAIQEDPVPSFADP
mmetsp:Transcript_29898/g.69552  ORF Transcript_29898/g.69552 Transcript_29898/m.69552 type:complete len:553 (+) Transcript_29898:228-1886(+)|eukprot:CAMPEP_0178395574 /NCGR_PEP_ID=MMETSP0689_2-20121128/13289_1 /TAXON_ID=160604 /ORGANISM="Amphidinium massartii, Strain CS-259" /LENGTH=552 /DNA_ID=CAMNT_0020016233 /DNA_START=137 /DNA_END=1795 /DNA_ORIENTATION=+